MKILLIRCPPISAGHCPDIGLAYIASCLLEEGHDVSVFDLNMELYHILDKVDKDILKHSNLHSFENFDRNLLIKYSSFFERVFDRIKKLNPEIVGFNVWNSNACMSVETAKRLKDRFPSIVTIFGGPECYPLLSGEKFARETFIDLVIYGEAELTIKKAIELIHRDRRIPSIPGSIINVGGTIKDCGWGEYVKKLDDLPRIALDIFPLGLYAENNLLPISFSRGCFYSCEYCPRGMYPKFRWRSPENIIQEIEYLIQKYPGMNSFRVCDASITSNLKQIEKLCDLILSKSIDIKLQGFASTNPQLNYKLLSKMKTAGFNNLCYGVESGSERLLGKLGKKINIETIERVIKETFEAGIGVAVDMMVGMPDESEEDFRQSMDFLSRNKRYIHAVGINEYGDLPYSYVFSHMQEFLRIPNEIKRIRHKEIKSFIDPFYIAEAQKFNYD